MTMTITFKNTKKFEKFLSPAHMKILREEVHKATATNLAVVQDAIVDRIMKRGRKTKNAPLTLALKDTKIPLMDTGQMAKAVEAELQDSFNGVVGFLKDQKSSHGLKMSVVVPGLEQGFTVRITPAMRRLLFLKMRQAGIADSAPDKKSTRGAVLRIPPRPFITPVFNSRKIRAQLQKNWKLAVRRAYARMGAL